MADIPATPDEWINEPGKVPWGEADFDNPDQAKTDSIRKSWWGTNRAANGAWNLIREVGGKVDGLVKSVAALATDVVRVRTYVARIETKVDALSAKVDNLGSSGN